MTEVSPKRRTTRTQIYIVIVALLIVAATGYVYVYMRQAARTAAAKHQQTFDEYVLTHKLGKVAEIDTGTGIDPMSYILTLTKSVPDNQRAAFATDLAHRYAEYDHGSVLIIVYVNPQTHKQQPIAESHYDDARKQLQLTVTFSSGQTQQINEHENW